MQVRKIALNFMKKKYNEVKIITLVFFIALSVVSFFSARASDISSINITRVELISVSLMGGDKVGVALQLRIVPRKRLIWILRFI